MKRVLFSIIAFFFFACAGVVRAENTGVPSECEDVMLQAFYWNSYNVYNMKYGCTKWTYLLKDTAAINANFDVVWLPPSARSKGGVGYYHTQLSSQDSDWGTRKNLEKLIAALHAGNTKVLGDVVINHRGSNDNGWCTFYADNFGEGYGSFQLTEAHICAGDECFYDGDSNCKGSSVHGADDTGTNDGGARDLDHSSSFVQDWAKAYVRWMREVMKYDGFRYDMTRGYAGKYLQMYNEASNPYMSVSEFWTDINPIVEHLAATGYNTMVFDFPLKSAMGTAIKDGSYGKLKKSSSNMRGKGLSKYAVTFIDNHDTFERPEEDACNQEFSGCNADLNSALVKNRILQANAYILMMPGVPCVFWPHWNKYRDQLIELIALRKLAGIHSESVVTNEVGNSTSKYYSGMIQGHRHKIVLRIGPKRPKDIPDGFRLALEGGDNGDYTIFISENEQGVGTVRADVLKGEKFMKDGRLYIRHGEHTYDILGNKIQ